MSERLLIAMVAGEASGDRLGANLVRELKSRVPHASFYGVGGPLMEKEGFQSRFDMESLSVNGIIDPLKRLPRLIEILLTLKREILASPPDVFVGVDYNFFNLMLEGMLKKKGISTAHYVSPTVWAWRRGRLRKIRRSVDLMMTLYPFETEIYRDSNINVCFVGHPRADEIPVEQDPTEARAVLGYGSDDRLLAILPGSRAGEVKRSGVTFLRAARLCAEKKPALKFVIPASSPRRHEQILALIAEEAPELSIQVLDGQALEAMAAADMVLVNSGTATLEALLLKKPMVMSYQLGSMTYALISRMVTTRFFALPNILAGRELVPEFIQDRATPEALAGAILERLEGSEGDDLVAEFEKIHLSLKRDAGARAAEAVLDLIGVNWQNSAP